MGDPSPVEALLLTGETDWELLKKYLLPKFWEKRLTVWTNGNPFFRISVGDGWGISVNADGTWEMELDDGSAGCG